jgi:hypothetical protein
MDKENNRSPMVEIVGATLGIFLVVAVMFILFAKTELGLLVPISWAFIVLGIFAAIFQYKIMIGPQTKKK